MWATIGNFIKKATVDKLKKTTLKASLGDENARRKLMLFVGAPIVFLFISLFVVLIVILGPILMASEYIQDVKSDLPNFIQSFMNENGWCSPDDDTCEKQAEQSFYEELSSVNDEKNGQLDTELITGTIMYNVLIEPDLYQIDEDGYNQKFISYYCDAMMPFDVPETVCSLYVRENYDEIYKNNRENYVKIYTNYRELKQQFCFENEKSVSDVISETAISLFGGPLRDIQLGTKTVQEACEFVLWNSSEVANAVVNTDKYFVTYKNGRSDIAVLANQMLSGGRLDYTKYRKYLVEHYIPDNYKEAYINEEDKDRAIERIADEIMLFASKKETQLALSGYNSFYSACSGVTINNGGALEYHDLEEYVAGVVAGENGGAGPEALKLQALAARSFAVKNCDRVISNSQNDQVYKSPTDATIEAANATAGQILSYNGDIFEVSFASYPRSNYRGGFPGYEASGYLCSDVDCSTGSDGRQWCTTTLYKQPNMESFELYMPDTTLSGGLWNGLHLTNQAGHCYGVSQVASRYYEDEKSYTYEQMVKEFFSPGVEITSILSSFGNVTYTEGSNFLPYEFDRFLTEKGSSVAQVNTQIKQAVLSAGAGSRAGVVASVNALVSGLSQYGVKLPYISSISGQDRGKYYSYGVDPEWGTNGKWYSSVYARNYYQLGMDCSGLVSWAIHNGGYKYLYYNSGGFHDNVGVLHAYGTFNAQPGDLLWHSGHIAIIVGISDDGKYVVAEESGGEDGLIVTNKSMDSSSFTHIIDMTSFYDNASNLDLAYYQGG